VRGGRRFFTRLRPVSLTCLSSLRAAEEAAKYNKVNIAATDKANKFTGAQFSRLTHMSGCQV